MKEVFGYIVGLGAPVMMPIIFTILGVCIGIKLGKALKSGLLVGVGFVGLSIVTALLTTALGPALNSVVDIYDLQLKVFDMGWPAAASIAYNTSVGALIIPICLGVNLLMLLTRTTKTVNIDSVELLAFRLYRRVGLLRYAQLAVGLLRSCNLLHHYAGYRGFHCKEIPEVLREYGRYFDSAAFLCRFRAVRLGNQQGTRQDSRCQ